MNQDSWICTNTVPPARDQAVEFLIHDSRGPLHGVFVEGAFRTRWFVYPAAHVTSWRPLDTATANMAAHLDMIPGH